MENVNISPDTYSKIMKVGMYLPIGILLLYLLYRGLIAAMQTPSTEKKEEVNKSVKSLVF